MSYMLEHPIWIVALVAMILITVFVCFKAASASSKRYKANEAIMKKLKEENILRNEFSVLTASLIEKAEADRLFKGVALNLQKKISDAADMKAEFDKLTDGQKEIYALSFVIEDGGEKLSEFFKANGQPVTGSALDAFRRLFSGKALEIFESEFDSYDSDNETASVIPAEIEKKDAEFAECISADEICGIAGNFIKNHPENFI